jgi:hypothetical protein
MEHTFTVIVTGPKAYLPEGIRVEQMIITQDEIEDSREDEETDDEVISNLKNDTKDEWEQHWCQCMILDEENAKKLLEQLAYYHGK